MSLAPGSLTAPFASSQGFRLDLITCLPMSYIDLYVKEARSPQLIFYAYASAPTFMPPAHLIWFSLFAHTLGTLVRAHSITYPPTAPTSIASHQRIYGGVLEGSRLYTCVLLPDAFKSRDGRHFPRPTNVSINQKISATHQ
jgi:hypothetical protein